MVVCARIGLSPFSVQARDDLWAERIGDLVAAGAPEDCDLDAVIDSGDCSAEPTTVIDFSQAEPEVLRRGSGDTSRFE